MSDRNRTAEAPIRGFLYQAYRSALAWVELPEGSSLVFEGIEDLDHYLADSDTPLRAEQIKYLVANITARSEAVYKTIAEFLCAYSEGLANSFMFTTTAMRGRQQTEKGKHQNEAEGLIIDILMEWEKLDPTIPEHVQKLASELSKLMNRYLRPEEGAKTSKHHFFSRIECALNDLSKNQRWRGFLEAVDWHFNAGGLDEVRSSIREALKAKRHPLPDLLVDRIVHQVLLVSTGETIERRRVSVKDLDKLFQIANEELQAWHQEQKYWVLANRLEGIERKLDCSNDKLDEIRHDVREHRQEFHSFTTNKHNELERRASTFAQAISELGDARLNSTVEHLNRGAWTKAECDFREIINTLDAATDLPEHQIASLKHASRTFRSIALLRLGHVESALEVFDEVDPHLLKTSGSRFAYAQVALLLERSDSLAGVQTKLAPSQQAHIRTLAQLVEGELPDTPPTEPMLALHYASEALKAGTLNKTITVCLSAIHSLKMADEIVAFVDAAWLVAAAFERRLNPALSGEQKLPRDIAIAGLDWLRQTVPALFERNDLTADLTNLLHRVVVGFHRVTLERIAPNEVFDSACAQLDYEAQVFCAHPSWEQALTAIQKNDFVLAIDLLGNEESRRVATPGCCFYIAKEALGAGKKTVAERFSRRAVEIVPSLPFTALHAETLLWLERPKEALYVLDMVGGSKDPKTLSIAAQANALLGRLHEARELAHTWEGLDTRSSSPRLLLAQIQVEMGHPATGAEDAWRVFRDEPDLPVLQLGLIADLQRSSELRKERKRERALALHKELLKHNPSSEVFAARYHLATALDAFDLLEQADFDWMKSQNILQSLSISDALAEFERLNKLRNALADGFQVGEAPIPNCCTTRKAATPSAS